MTIKAIPEGGTGIDYSFARPYVRPQDGVPAFIVDIDGTTMLRTSRGIHDYHKVAEDVPNDDVLRVLKLVLAGAMLGATAPVLIFVSGRPEQCRTDTLSSLEQKAEIMPDLLYMRPDFLPNGKRDFRPDYIVKYEIFNRHLRGYDIIAAFDDRLQVVNLWRHLGILCLDVAGGAF